MLQPDPAARPTVDECMALIGQIIVEEEARLNMRVKSPSGKGAESKMLRAADNYFADPGPSKLQRLESWDAASPMCSRMFATQISNGTEFLNSPLVSLANLRAKAAGFSSDASASNTSAPRPLNLSKISRKADKTDESKSSPGIRSNESSKNQISPPKRRNSPPKPDFPRDKQLNPKMRPLVLDRQRVSNLRSTPKSNDSPSLRYIKMQPGLPGDTDPYPQGVTMTKPKSNFAEYCKNRVLRRDKTDSSVSILCLSEERKDPTNLDDLEVETAIPSIACLVPKLMSKPVYYTNCRLLSHLAMQAAGRASYRASPSPIPRPCQWNDDPLNLED